MKITVVLADGTRHNADLPYDGATHVVASVDCPHGCQRPVVLGIVLKLKIRGTGIDRTTHDTHYAGAVALCCQRRIGTIETKMSTVFGLDEDQRVLGGPWKVF